MKKRLKSISRSFVGFVVVLFLAIMMLDTPLIAQEREHHWIPQPTLWEEWWSMDCADSLHCIISAREGTWVENHLLVSDDGGRNWRAVLSDASSRDGMYPYHTVDVSYPTPHLAIVATDGGFVYRSTDRGQNWERRQVYDSSVSGGILLGRFERPQLDMYDTLHGIISIPLAVGDTAAGPCYRTDDGGLSWNRLPTMPVPLEWGFSKAIDGLCFGADRYSFIVRDNRERKKVATTVDGGRSWEFIELPVKDNSPFPLSEGLLYNLSLERVSENTSYLAGTHFIYDSGSFSYLARSDDGGLSWRCVYHDSLGLYSGITDIAFRDELNGLALVLGVILRTTDGGSTWSIDSLRDAVPFGLYNGYIEWLTDQRALFAEVGGQLYVWDASVSDINKMFVPDLERWCRMISSSSEHVEIALQMAESADVEVRLWNLHGELVARYDAGRSESGERHITVPFSTMMDGHYFLQVSMGKARAVLPVKHIQR